MLRDYKIGQHFGMDSKKQGLMDLMVKHNITKDLRNMKDYEKKAFLHDIKSMRSDQLSIQGKRAFEEIYGPQKVEKAKSEIRSVNVKKDTYDEILAKKKILQTSINIENSQQKTSNRGFGLFGFGSNKNVRQAEQNEVVVRAEHKTNEEKMDEVRARLNEIQS